MRVASLLACCAALGFAGWLVAGVSDEALVPATAVLALAGAVMLAIAGVRKRILTSPLILLGVPLLLSLSAAMLPITRIFGDWSLETLGVAVLLVAAPLAGVGAATAVTKGRTPKLERGVATPPHPRRLVTVCALMCAVGIAVYLQEWSSVGGPPLLSANIDKARFGINYGLLHVLTQGLPLALLIASWARIAHPKSFTALQRRALEAVVIVVPVVLALGAGRTLVLLPLLTVIVVAARYVSPRAARRMLIALPIAILLFSSLVFLTRESQHTGAVSGAVLYNESGDRASPVDAAFRSLSINLGEQLRVVAELRDGDIRTPPFTTSLWFAHNVAGRAVDPTTVTGPNAGGWLTSMYAGPLLLDFGLTAALLFGLVLGACAHLLYQAFARGRSVTIIWVYAYLAGPIAYAFYLNVFLYFIYPIIDLIALIVLSRLLVKPSAGGRHGVSVARRILSQPADRTLLVRALVGAGTTVGVTPYNWRLLKSTRHLQMHLRSRISAPHPPYEARAPHPVSEADIEGARA